MSKFKVGDKVVVNKTRSGLTKGDEAIIVRSDGDGYPRIKLTKAQGAFCDIGNNVTGYDDDLDYCRSSDKIIKQLPLCYAEIQKENLDENCKVRDSIEKDLAVEIGGVSFRFDGDNFLIGSSFYLPIKEAVEAGKWFRKMTATPKKKVVKKVSKKVAKKVAKKKVGRPAKNKVAKKLDLLKLSKK